MSDKKIFPVTDPPLEIPEPPPVCCPNIELAKIFPALLCFNAAKRPSNLSEKMSQKKRRVKVLLHRIRCERTLRLVVSRFVKNVRKYAANG